MAPRQGQSVTLRAAAFTGGLLLLLLAACGGGGGPRLELPTPVPTGRESSLLDLERFHYVASLTLKGNGPDGAPVPIVVSTEGDFQSPDHHAFTYSTQLQGATFSESAVVIGDKIWLRRGADPWQEATLADAQAQQLFAAAFSPIRPNFLGGPEWRNVRETVRRLPATPEFVNDVRADHYQVGPEGVQHLASFLAQQDIFQQVQDLHWDIWLAEGGDWPVRLLASGTMTSDLPILQELGLSVPAAWELRIDISRPNDPKLVVTAPAS
jgi:hypothetical protein